jgi:hypothetical protein
VENFAVPGKSSVGLAMLHTCEHGGAATTLRLNSEGAVMPELTLTLISIAENFIRLPVKNARPSIPKCTMMITQSLFKYDGFVVPVT